jgi:hypothetical protein
MLSLKRDTSSTSKAEREINELTARRQTLLARLSAAEQEHERVAAKRVEIVSIGADDAAIAPANTAVATAIASVGGFRSAIEAVDAKIADAETALRTERDTADRQRFADWVDGKAAQITEAAQQFQTASMTLRGALSSTSSAGAGIAAALGQAGTALESDIKAVVFDLTKTRDAVLRGGAPIPDARSAPPAPPPPAPDVERTSVYALKPLRWLDPADGRIRVVAKHGTAALPTALAEFVVAKNLGDLSTSNRARELMKAFGEVLWPPPASEALDLDALAAEGEETAA